MKSVLIADSEREYCEKLKARLCEGGGFEVKTVNDGDGVLESIGEKLPDVLILGAFMHKKDGLSVLSEFERIGLCNKITIFVTAPNISDEMLLLFQKHNVTHIFIKPVNMTLVENHIRKAVGMKHEKHVLDADRRVEEAIVYYLRKVSISPKLKGYSFLKKLVAYLLKYGDKKTYTEILMLIAKENGRHEWKSIDRNIRTAIESAWIKGNIEEQYVLFGYSVSPTKGRPTNKEFSAMITQKVKESLAHSN